MSECANCRPQAPKMTSSSPASPSRNLSTGDRPDADLLRQVDTTIAAALDCGALQPIRTEQTTLVDGGITFSVRWVSSLALKDRARVDTVTRRNPDFNPFLPPEPALTVSALGDDHLLVLNKFPVIERHLLVVTRRYEAQTAPLTPSDLAALAQLVGAHGGLGFCNGGAVAGASQPHKHLQWVPTPAGSGPGFEAFTAALPQAAPGSCLCNPGLAWAHVFVRLDEDAWARRPQAGQMLHAAFRTACAALAISADADPMPPYNLLVSREWLLLVPRRCEKWHDMSVNSLGYAGSLFVRDHHQVERLRAVGPLAALAAVSLPR